MDMLCEATAIQGRKRRKSLAMRAKKKVIEKQKKKG